MGSLADTFGPARDRSGTAHDDGPVLRPGPVAASGDGEVARITTELSLLGGVLFVAGIGIAFFSSTLLSALAYVLLVAPGSVLVGRFYLAAASDVDRPATVTPPSVVDAWVESGATLLEVVSPGTSGTAPGRRGYGRHARGRRGRGPLRSLSRRWQFPVRRSTSLPVLLRRLGRRLVAYARTRAARSRRGERL